MRREVEVLGVELVSWFLINERGTSAQKFREDA